VPAPSFYQGRENGDDGKQSSAREVRRLQHWRPEARPLEGPGDCQVVDVVPGAIAIGPLLPVTGERELDELGSFPAEALVVE
jgi:hypothetical protein